MRQRLITALIITLLIIAAFLLSVLQCVINLEFCWHGL